MSNISPSFTWDEVIHTDTGIGNEIPEVLKSNAVKHAELLEECRVFAGPLRVSSWYRCPAVNGAVGGEATSYHLQGLAADVVPKGDVFSVFKMLVASGIDYDKIIYEKRSSEWIHIQSPMDPRAPRKQAFTAHRNGSSMEYEVFNG